MDKCFAAHEWLSDADLHRNGLESHILPAAGAVHLLCRVEQRPELTFTTRVFSDLRYQLEANQSLLHRFAEGVATSAVSSRSNGCIGLAVETVPYALWILSAGEGRCALNRAVTSYELLDTGEMEAFQNHVNTLKSLGLSYRAASEDKSDKNRSSARMKLEPPIDLIAQYEGLMLSPEQTRREISSSVSV